MAEIVNLNAFRKQKARNEKAAKAAENRAVSGQSKAQKLLQAAKDALAAKRLMDHKKPDE